ncbi:hypothetical protein SAMN05421594_4727 [Chryseobacterium oleae]|uniref:Uncharacterized protein n=1 Tax=Chryseobacterium oleae TaxID=491207 RepID=A0A1I5CZK7_CHROL|nr:hypothetical protein [Chryseobacterium oleae]SFN92286.1 hypothetical protein SAMN05421594_4727 [Chryseobacterium oleae]
MTFYSNRKFKIWAYVVSHSSLLLRSEMKYPDQDDYSEDEAYNIDLEFWAVSYIDIPTNLYELDIKEIAVKDLSKDINQDLLMYNMKIFEIKSKKEKYHIIAGGLLIGKNKWENQDRIFDYQSNLVHDEIVFQTK